MRFTRTIAWSVGLRIIHPEDQRALGTQMARLRDIRGVLRTVIDHKRVIFGE